MTITHSKVSGIANPADPTKVGGEDWDAAHVIADNTIVAAKLSASSTDVLFGRSTAGAGAGEQVACTPAGRALIDDATAADQRQTLGLGTAATTAATDYATAGHSHVEGDIAVSTTSVVVGRKSASGGACEEVTASEVLDFIGSTRGSVLYRGAAGWSALTPGTATHVLTSNGAGADPSYQAAGGGSPGGSSGQVQYNNASAFGGASALEISSGAPVIVSAAAVTPSSGRWSLYGDDFAGRQMPGFKSPDGFAYPLQPHLGCEQWMAWVPNSGSNSVTAIGGAAGSTLGTVTARAATSGSFFSTTRRTSYVSASGAGSGAQIRSTTAAWFIGSGSGSGGFTFVGRFGIGDAAAVADASLFVGLYQASSVGSSNPTNLASVIGVGGDNADTTMSVFHNDAAGNATKVSLGPNFPINTQNTDVYEVILFASAYTSTVGYLVKRLGTAYSATGTLSSNLPATSTALYPQFHRYNGATALAVDLAFMGLYMASQ